MITLIIGAVIGIGIYHYSQKK